MRWRFVDTCLPMVIAIDGPAGAGKSTVAREVARRLGYRYLDTGAMYRALTLLALERGSPLDDADTLAGLIDEAIPLTADPRVRSAAVDAAVSTVSAHPAVRTAMREAQRSFLAAGDAVAEGRDIGAVVWPEAELKLWLDADPSERARRRVMEVAGGAATAEALLARDRRDASQLRPAPDAVLLDTTALDAGSVVERILALVQERS